MIPHIRLKKGKEEYLLIQDEDSFHIIGMDDNLTEEKRRLILEKCPNPDQMQEMGLYGMTIAKSDLEGVAVYGIATGDDFEFHFGKKKIGYKLARRYDQKYMDSFLRGIPRMKVPARRKMKGSKFRDWRLNEQTPEGRKTMKRVSFVLNLVSTVMVVLVLAPRKYYDLWSVGAMICAAVSVFLGIVHPEYFVFGAQKQMGKRVTRAKVHELFMGFVPLTILTFRSFSIYTFFDVLQPIGCGVIAGLVVGLILILLSVDLKEDIGIAMMAVVMSMILCTGVMAQGNHLLAKEDFVFHEIVVLDKEYINRSKGSDEYNCVVKFPDGRMLTIDLNSKKEFDKYDVGDSMTIPMRTGAFGIEYGYYGYID